MDINQINKQLNFKNFYFPELDGLRFFAFLLVFIHHNELLVDIPFLSIFHINGWIGVDLFFVLSAYLFSKLLIEEYNKTKTISFKKFYVRRLFRIWPIYFLAVTFSVLLTTYINKGISETNIIYRIIGLFTFTDNIFSAFMGYNPILFTSHLWTISYEEQFYVFIPIIIYFLVRTSGKTRMLFLISSLLVLNLIRFLFIYNNAPYPSIWTLPVTHFDAIILGIVIGFSNFGRTLQNDKPIYLIIFATLIFLSINYLPPIDHNSYWLILTYNLVGACTGLILFAVLKSRNLKKFLSNKVLIFLGKRSYGLYLYHFLGNAIANFIVRKILGDTSNHVVQFILAFSITCMLAVISYKFIEMPFLILKKRYEIIHSRPV